MNGWLLDARLVAMRCVLPIGMRLVPLPTLFRWLEPRHVTTTEDRAQEAIRRSEKIAPRLRVPDTCLYRAMVRYAALRSAGLDVSFKMGIHRDAPESGHAWVERDGVPIGEPADTGLVTTFSFTTR